MASVLETFHILFKGDTKDAEQGVGKLDAQLGDLAKGAAVAAGAFLSLGATIAAAIANAENVTAIARTSDALGIAIEDVDALGRAMERTGGEAKDMRDSLVDLAEKMGEGIQDSESIAAKSFAKFGIKLKNADGTARNAAEGMLDLADAVQGLSKGEAVFRLKELGLTDNRTVELIIKGRKAIEDMIKREKELGVVTKEDALVAQEFKTALADVKTSFSVLSQETTSAMLPSFTRFLNLAKDIIPVIQENGKAIAVIGGVALAVVSPIAAIGAAIALVVDDILAWRAGQDSLIGAMFEKFPLVQRIFEVLGYDIMLVVDAFKAMFDWVMKVGDQLSSIEAPQWLQDLGAAASNALGLSAANPINSAGNAVTNNSGGNTVRIDNLTVDAKGGDSKQISQNIRTDLMEQMRVAVNNFDNGVAA